MWPLSYCGGGVQSCLDWFTSLEGGEQFAFGAGAIISVFILLRLISGIYKFLGLDEV